MAESTQGHEKKHYPKDAHHSQMTEERKNRLLSKYSAPHGQHPKPNPPGPNTDKEKKKVG